MKNVKTILIIFSLVMMYSFVSAQGGCQGGNIKVYKGASGCGCSCMKECVTPAELPTYLANGWNTNGCWKCCKFKNWVEAGNQIDPYEVHFHSEIASTTASFPQGSENDVQIQVLDMTGRYVDTPRYLQTEDNEIMWDQSGLNTGMYILNVKSGHYS